MTNVLQFGQIECLPERGVEVNDSLPRMVGDAALAALMMFSAVALILLVTGNYNPVMRLVLGSESSPVVELILGIREQLLGK